MRRGLIKWDADELPVAVLRDRLKRLQRAMAAAGLDAIILYTNFIRCAAVSWLTGFSPYWGDGVLVVRREGDPLLSTMLSKRMEGWIQSVMPAAGVITSPTPGKIAGSELARARARKIGVLELDDFPAGFYADVAAALPDAVFVDATAVFSQARAPADAAERQLLSRADQIAAESVSQLVLHPPLTAGEAAAVVEKHARLHGAEEIYVAIAADLDRSNSFLRLTGEHVLGRRFAVRATVAYKGSWVRRARTFSQDAQDWFSIRESDAWFTEVIATASAANFGQVLSRQEAAPNAQLQGWFAEAPVGTRPLNIVTPSDSAPALVLTAALQSGAVPWCGSALMLFQ